MADLEDRPIAGRLIDVVRKAVALNLQTTTSVFGLAKDYVRALDGILRDSAESGTGNGETAPVATGPEPSRPAIELVGRKGERVTGAFSLTNSSAGPLTISPVIEAEGDAARATLDPAVATVEPGGEAVVRVSVELTDVFEEGRTYSGAIAVPGLSSQTIPFRIRRIEAGTVEQGEPEAPAGAAVGAA